MELRFAWPFSISSQAQPDFKLLSGFFVSLYTFVLYELLQLHRRNHWKYTNGKTEQDF